MALHCGLRVPTQGTPQDTGAFAARVEAAGFDFMWMPDRPILAARWRDIYSHLTRAALTTSSLRLGPGVTNPLTRHPVTTASAILSIDDASNGRTVRRLGLLILSLAGSTHPQSSRHHYVRHNRSACL